MFVCVEPNQELPYFRPENLRDFPLLKNVEGDDTTPVTHEYYGTHLSFFFSSPRYFLMILFSPIFCMY